MRPKLLSLTPLSKSPKSRQLLQLITPIALAPFGPGSRAGHGRQRCFLYHLHTRRSRHDRHAAAPRGGRYRPLPGGREAEHDVVCREPPDDGSEAERVESRASTTAARSSLGGGGWPPETGCPRAGSSYPAGSSLGESAPESGQ